MPQHNQLATRGRAEKFFVHTCASGRGKSVDNFRAPRAVVLR